MRKAKQPEQLLTLTRIERTERRRSTHDNRRFVNVTTATYRGEDGYEYRKAFESYGAPNVPTSGTHPQLNKENKQW